MEWMPILLSCGLMAMGMLAVILAVIGLITGMIYRRGELSRRLDRLEERMRPDDRSFDRPQAGMDDTNAATGEETEAERAMKAFTAGIANVLGYQSKIPPAGGEQA